MDDTYYDNKKPHFKIIFEKEWNSNISDFLKYVEIEITRESIGSMNELKSAIQELAESNQNE